MKPLDGMSLCECGHPKRRHFLFEGRCKAGCRCSVFSPKVIDISGVFMPEESRETVDHPSHYGGDTVHEHIKCISAWGLDKSYRLGQASKYLCRAGKKPGVDTVEDLKKAIWYIQSEIDRLTPAMTVAKDVNDKINFEGKTVTLEPGVYKTGHEVAEAMKRSYQKAGFPIRDVKYNDKTKMFEIVIDETRAKVKMGSQKKE